MNRQTLNSGLAERLFFDFKCLQMWENPVADKLYTNSRRVANQLNKLEQIVFLLKGQQYRWTKL